MSEMVQWFICLDYATATSKAIQPFGGSFKVAAVFSLFNNLRLLASVASVVLHGENRVGVRICLENTGG